MCSDEPGWYYAAKGPQHDGLQHQPSTSSSSSNRSRNWPPSQQQLEMEKESAVRWLQRIPGDFWLRVHAAFCEINLRRRAEMIAVNQAMGYNPRKSFLKHVSYCGAIRVPDAFPSEGGHIIWTDPITRERYLDPTNKVYKDSFKVVWPTVMMYENEGTIADLLEAVLGLAWRQRQQRLTAPGIGEDFVAVLEVLLLAEYSLQSMGA